MAQFNLNWNPGNPYETGLTQQVQYKLRSAQSYTVLATLPGFKDFYQATSLQDDKVYNFRIANNCDNTYSPVINTISFICPDLTTFRDDNEMVYSFTPDNSGDVDSYKLTLYKNGVFATEEIYNSPFVSSISGVFAGLDGLSEYTIVLSAKADEFTGSCDAVTGIPVVCVSITDINASSNP